MRSHTRIRFVAALLVGLAPAAAHALAPAQSCAITKLKAAAKKTSAKLTCVEKSIARGTPVDPLCLSRAESKFLSAFQKAEARGGCVTSGDAGSVETTVDACVANVSSLLPAVTTTTVSTTTTTSSSTTVTTFPQCGGVGNSCDGACPDGSFAGICAFHAGGGITCVGRLACSPASCTSDADCGGGNRCVAPGGPFGVQSCCGPC